jgi:hypothetical protein
LLPSLPAEGIGPKLRDYKEIVEPLGIWGCPRSRNGFKKPGLQERGEGRIPKGAGCKVGDQPAVVSDFMG